MLTQKLALNVNLDGLQLNLHIARVNFLHSYLSHKTELSSRGQSESHINDASTTSKFATNKPKNCRTYFLSSVLKSIGSCKLQVPASCG